MTAKKRREQETTFPIVRTAIAGTLPDEHATATLADSGLYETRLYSLPIDTPIAARAQCARCPEILELLEKFRDVLAKHVTADWPKEFHVVLDKSRPLDDLDPRLCETIFTREMGDAPSSAPVVLDALHGLERLRQLAFLLKKIDGVLLATMAVEVGFDLGRIAERISVRPAEPQVVQARAQSARARTAGKSREVFNEKQQKQAAEEIAALIAAGMPEQSACKKLAPKYGVHFKTLKRYCQKHSRH